MRKAGLWVVAVCVGCVAAWVVQTAVLLRYGTVTGLMAVLYSLGLMAVFGFTTAWVVTWLEAISRPRTRPMRRAHPGD